MMMTTNKGNAEARAGLFCSYRNQRPFIKTTPTNRESNGHQIPHTHSTPERYETKHTQNNNRQTTQHTQECLQ